MNEKKREENREERERTFAGTICYIEAGATYS
jgi:hypothetical protein